MWKIKSPMIKKVYRFTDRFVLDLLKWATQNTYVTNVNQITNTTMNPQLRAMSNRFPNIKKYMVTLASCPEIKKVQKSYELFSKHYPQIIRGDNILIPKLSRTTLDDLKEIFQYFYKYLMDNQFFWSTYNSQSAYITKNQIRTNSKEYRKICPYCDQKEIISSITNNMDHFLPTSKFPFLSLYGNNIVISCVTCNNNLIKKDNIYLPILHPYFDDIYKALVFNFNENTQKVTIHIRKKHRHIKKCNIRAKNFIRTLKLNEQYEDMWEHATEEKEWLEGALDKKYHENKVTITIYEVSTIIEDTIEERKKHLLNYAGKRSFRKLKIDYCDHYKSENDFQNFFIKELRDYRSKTLQP